MRGQSRFIGELRKGWWHQDVRPAVSRATYAAIAQAAGGRWAPGDIERALGKANNRDTKSEGLSNKFRKMWKDQTVPSLPTLREVVRAFPSCNADYWAEHPIFFLLDARQEHDELFARSAISYALDSLQGFVRTLVWKNDVTREPWTGRILKSLDDRSMLNVLSHESLEDLDSLDRLTLSTALAKMALASEGWGAHNQAAWITRHEFGKALTRNAPLLSGWECLIQLYGEQIWQPRNVSYGGVIPTSRCGRDDILRYCRIAEEEGVKLPPLGLIGLAEKQ